MLIPIIRATGITRDAVSVILADQTGIYNSVTNPGGYGTPNPPAPPIAVGFKFRNWNQTADYYNVATLNTSLINELLTVTGHKFDSGVLGFAPFRSGVHHIRYYSFETIVTVVNLTQGSKVVTRVSGVAPNTYNAAYKAVIILTPGNVLLSNVLMIDKTVAATSTTFELVEPWPYTSVTNHIIKLGTESDLKVIFPQLADKCINERIGNLATQKICDQNEVDTLTRLLLWKFSAQVKFDCKDYTGADNMLSAVYDECNACPDNLCKTC